MTAAVAPPGAPAPAGPAAPVLFVSPHAVLGGAEAVLRTLVTELGDGWVAKVVMLQDGPLAEQLRADGVPVITIPTGPRWSMLRSAVRLRREIAVSGASVVHANGVKAALVAGLALLGRRTPMLWMKHDTAGDPWLARMVAARAAAIVGVSETVNAPFRGRQRRRAHVVHNGVPDRHVDRARSRARLAELVGAAPGDELVGLAGRLCVGKGQHELLAVAPGVLAERPHVRFVLIGGDDPAFPGHLARLEADAQSRGIADRVAFVGHRRDAADLLAGCDAVVVPSVLDDAHGWREGFGLVPVEAMQAGTPVVAYASGALPEVLGADALLVPEGDRPALAAAVLRVLGDPSLASDLAERGRARVATRYRLGRSLEQMRGHYRSLEGSH